jgi:membrane-associated phospholipid phosphatase
MDFAGTVTRTGWILPQVVTVKNKPWVGAIGAIIAALMYIGSNRFHLFEPQLLTYTSLDQAIPFVPWTFWIYASEYLFFFAIYLSLKSEHTMNRYIYSFFTLQTVSVLIFIFWPTTFPRDDFPLIRETMDALTFAGFSALRATDSPASCAPSLHVSSVYLSSMMLLYEGQKHSRTLFKIFFGWATLIALSTLTTKQHYIIDLVTGFGMAVLVLSLFKSIQFRESKSGRMLDLPIVRR